MQSEHLRAMVVRSDSENGGDGINYARAVSFLPGEVLAKVEHTPHLLRRLGASVAKSDAGLAGWEPAAADRFLTWDLAQAGQAAPHERGRQRAMADSAGDRGGIAPSVLAWSGL